MIVLDTDECIVKKNMNCSQEAYFLDEYWHKSAFKIKLFLQLYLFSDSFFFFSSPTQILKTSVLFLLPWRTLSYSRTWKSITLYSFWDNTVVRHLSRAYYNLLFLSWTHLGECELAETVFNLHTGHTRVDAKQTRSIRGENILEGWKKGYFPVRGLCEKWPLQSFSPPTWPVLWPLPMYSFSYTHKQCFSIFMQLPME